MRRALFLVLALEYFASIHCTNNTSSNGGFGYELLLQEIEQIKMNQLTLLKLVSELPERDDKPQLNLTSALLSADFQWVTWWASNTIPQRAVSTGLNWNNGALYVGRVRHNGNDCVAKASPINEKCYIAYKGREIAFDQCEVLTGSGFTWMPTNANAVLPVNAFPCGRKANGEAQYIGRVKHVHGSTFSETAGNIDRISGSLSIPFGDLEYRYNKYEVLVRN